MRLVRFRSGGRDGFGVHRGEFIQPISWEPFEEVADDLEEIETGAARLLAPVVPTKIVGVGLNYTDHAGELGMEIPGEPILFLKAADTLLPPGGSVIYPSQSERVDYEAELAVVIGERTRSVEPEEALDHVLGYTCGLDITARDLQVADGQWTRAKCFDTFCPLGPWVETELDPGGLAIELRLNGEVRQSSSTSRMIFDVPFLVSFISSVMTLNPGDVIMTGTPPGVGEVSPGDEIEVSIEGIGTLGCSVSAPGE
ncbi:MAG: fumarylacetoacetate hydrolase family protein [Actinobacteria bacterium]|nr:fumarylacetoacetate hydrolase family protein [Actinomycetota bacterium]